MDPEPKYKIHFEPRVELGYDMTIIETFPDGSQLIHKQGHFILVDACQVYLSRYRMPANVNLFSFN